MSVTAFDNEAASKSLEDAGFTDVQIAALMGCMRRSADGAAHPPSVPDAIAKTLRDADLTRGGSIGHAIAMLVLALGGLGALLAILVRVA
jgi:hypothetical protein